mgnify:CR=1 FL=1
MTKDNYNNESIRSVDAGQERSSPGPYIARVLKHADPYYLGGLEVELLKVTEAGNTGETLGQTAIVYYASPFYGVTGSQHLGKNDNYSNTQKSYGWWAVPPDPGSLVLCTFVEGTREFGYWFGCIPEKGMTFMLPSGKTATEQVSGPVPAKLKGKRLPAGEYNKKITKPHTNNIIKYKRPVNEDYVAQLTEQGLIEDDIRGITTTSAQREFPSASFGFSTPGPIDKRGGSPQGEIGLKESKATVHVNRLGSSSIVIDDGDDKLIRKGNPANTPYEYINKESSESGGDVTRPANEVIRLETRTGAKIMMNTSEDLIYINNSRGTCWIEMTSNGKLDVYALDSVSFHTENDFNFTADRDINFEVGRDLNFVVNNNLNTSVAANYDLLIGIDGKITVRNDWETHVTNDMKTLVLNNQTEIITVNKDIIVGTPDGGDMKTTVNNNISVFAQKQINIEANESNIEVLAGTQISIEAKDANIEVLAGGDLKLKAIGTSNIKSKHHKETADRIDMNGPGNPAAESAATPEATTIEASEDNTALEALKSKFMIRIPQHEPWDGHENWNPAEAAPDKTEAIETSSQDFHFEDRNPPTDRTPINELLGREEE